MKISQNMQLQYGRPVATLSQNNPHPEAAAAHPSDLLISWPDQKITSTRPLRSFTTASLTYAVESPPCCGTSNKPAICYPLTHARYCLLRQSQSGLLSNVQYNMVILCTVKWSHANWNWYVERIKAQKHSSNTLFFLKAKKWNMKYDFQKL